MDCFDLNQLVLYSTTYGLTAKERRAYEQHLAECPPCRERINGMQRRLRDLDWENEKVCEEMRNSLEAYALGDLPAERREQVLQHVGECHACNAFQARVASLPDLQESLAGGVSVPPHLAKSIESALHEELGMRQRSAANGLQEIAERAKEFVNEICLSLSPLEPAAAFRGEEQPSKSEFIEIKHNGGDLVINVGLPSVIVELYSDREKYLDDGETDATGRFVFHEIKPGSYKIRVHGHRVNTPPAS